jgi:hypothetical protein
MSDSGFKLDEHEATLAASSLIAKLTRVEGILLLTSAVLGSLTGAGAAIEDTQITASLDDVKACVDGLRVEMSGIIVAMGPDLAGYVNGVAEADGYSRQ